MEDCFIEVPGQSIFPGLGQAVFNRFTATPLTIQRYTGNTGGAITGWAFTNPHMPALHKLSKIFSSVDTPIPGIFQAGQWTFSPSGFPISVLTGKLASDKVLKSLKRKS